MSGYVDRDDDNIDRRILKQGGSIGVAFNFECLGSGIGRLLVIGRYRSQFQALQTLHCGHVRDFCPPALGRRANYADFQMVGS